MNGDPNVTIMGNLTAAPDVRYTSNGTAVASMTIAHTPRTRREDQWEDGTPIFLKAEAWRDQAEHAAQSLSKGDRVVASGSLRQDEWTDKDTGEKRSAIKLVIDEIGASVRYADVQVRKATRNHSPAPVDPQTGETATQSQPPKEG